MARWLALPLSLVLWTATFPLLHGAQVGKNQASAATQPDRPQAKSAQSGLRQTTPPGRKEAKAEPLFQGWCASLPRQDYRKFQRVLVGSDWFEVYRIRPGVFAIYEPHQYEEVISYLITGSQRALLFDTGLGIADLRSVVAKLTELPVTVLNSHTHFDHIGDDWQFSEVLGVDTPYTRRNAKGATREELRDVVVPERFCLHPPKGFKPEDYAIPAFKIAHFVHDGETIALGDRTLEVLLTPGHTPDSLCLLDRQHKLLFTGDTFYPGPIFLYVPETDAKAYSKSVHRLAALVPQLDLLLPSHNVPAAKPEMLNHLADAFDQVQFGKAIFTVVEGRREYKFDGFSILTAQ